MLIHVGKFSSTEVESNIIFHMATLGRLSHSPYSPSVKRRTCGPVQSKTVTIAEELDARSQFFLFDFCCPRIRNMWHRSHYEIELRGLRPILRFRADAFRRWCKMLQWDAIAWILLLPLPTKSLADSESESSMADHLYLLNHLTPLQLLLYIQPPVLLDPPLVFYLPYHCN